MKLIVKVKLLPDRQQKQFLIKTVETFNEACNYISEIAFKEKKFGQVGLHHLCYRDVRNKFGLSAQFTVRAIGKVSESYRVEKKRQHVFRKYSAVVYDNRLLSFRLLSVASMLTVKGRIKVPVVFGSYAKLEQRRIAGQADLIYQKGKFFLCLVIDLPDKTPFKPKGILGVDLGIVNLATTSDGDNFSGKQVDNVRKRITKIKKALQKRGSKSAKRHLKKLSGRERRFKRTINHTISKQIVRLAEGTQRAIGLENLKGFRATVRKEQRDQFGKWAFFELRNLISYKAQLAGVPVFLVDPKNTSRSCSKCGHVSKSNRKSQSEFVCQKCGFSIHADFNGARNIVLKAIVNLPIAVHAKSLSSLSLGTAMPRQLAAG